MHTKTLNPLQKEHHELPNTLKTNTTHENIKPEQSENFKKSTSVLSLQKEVGVFLHGMLEKLVENKSSAPKKEVITTAIQQYIPNRLQRSAVLYAKWLSGCLNTLHKKFSLEKFTIYKEVTVTNPKENNWLVIDLLLVHERIVWIIDYKTTKPPETAQGVAPAIQEQINQYSNILQSVYPNYAVRKAVLWVQTGQLYEI